MELEAVRSQTQTKSQWRRLVTDQSGLYTLSPCPLLSIPDYLSPDPKLLQSRGWVVLPQLLFPIYHFVFWALGLLVVAPGSPLSPSPLPSPLPSLVLWCQQTPDMSLPAAARRGAFSLPPGIAYFLTRNCLFSCVVHIPLKKPLSTSWLPLVLSFLLVCLYLSLSLSHAPTLRQPLGEVLQNQSFVHYGYVLLSLAS